MFQGLVGSFLVVFVTEAGKAVLLSEAGRGGGNGRLPLERAMQAFVAPILLRAAGLDALGQDAEPDPPDRQLGEPSQRLGGGEGGAVVGAEDAGQAVGAEEPVEDRPAQLPLGRVEGLAPQQEAAVAVDDGQRVASWS